MPQFKLSTFDCTDKVIRARRVRRMGEAVLFEDKSGAVWRVVASVHHSRVDVVRRKVTELNGTERWITQPIEPAYIPPAPIERRNAS